jgi:tRNA(Ile)-lysidine synthase
MQIAKAFLARHWDGRRPLLLGYSGGPDSKALLYALREAGCGALHIAHVDHGWREESAKEAAGLKDEAEKLGLPFHSIRLEPPRTQNKEDLARKARLSYFRTLFDAIPFQALLLGHHADDLAETALKRVFEGAHLPFLGGMEPISRLEGMEVWRPFLHIRKREIFQFLSSRRLAPLLDATNRDPSFLRSRMREETIPLIAQSFGKEIVENLSCLSERASELKKYLDRRIASCAVRRGVWGAAVRSAGVERIELRHLLQKMAGEEGVVLPRTVLEPVLDWAEEKAPYRKIFCQQKWVIVRGEWIFLLSSDSGKALPEKGQLRKLTISFDATISKPDG